MIKLRGWGGATEFWDYGLESFTLMAGLAACTERIKLFASVAILSLHPALVARMATTVDSIAPGRFGVNIVAGWLRTEYAQLGLWPGDEHYRERYNHATEYATILQELWTTGVSDFKGEWFQLEDCHMKPLPSAHIDLVCAGQSSAGIDFCAEYGDYNFVLGSGINEPTAVGAKGQAVLEAAERHQRHVGVLTLFMIIAARTREEAFARFDHYNDGVDLEAMAWVGKEASHDPTAATSTEDTTTNRAAKTAEKPMANMGVGALIGSFEEVAAMLDEVATVPGVDGVMLVFDDFVRGIDEFGKHIQPLMVTRPQIRS
jgi:pyrimidine oxygenase